MSPANNPQTPKGQFSQVDFPTRSYGNPDQAQYRVFSDASNYVLVQADTATEAIKQSDIKHPVRVERHIPGKAVVLAPDWNKEDTVEDNIQADS